MEILVKFDYDNITYCVLEKEKKVILGKIINDNLSTNLDEKEIELIKLVLYKLKPGKKYIELTPFKLNKTKYKIYYDIKTGFRIFDPIPHEKDNKILNIIFNDFPLECYKKEDDEFTVKDAIRKGIKIGEKVVLVVLSSAILINGLSFFPDLMVKATEKIEDYNYEQVKLGNEELSDKEIVDKVNNAINDNENLSSDEKNYLLSNINIILDNKKYIDFNNLTYLLKTLDINYKIERDSNNVVGTYDSSNVITIYDCKDFEDADKSVLSHEYCHMFQNYFYNNYSSFLKETLASTFNNEYFNYDASYKKVVKYLCSLIEIIGPDPFREYQFSENDSRIFDEMNKIIKDEEKTIKLFQDLENYQKIHGSTNKEIEETNIEELEQEIYFEIKEFYESKYNRTMEDDLIMLYYLNFSLFEEKVYEKYKNNDNEDDKMMSISEKNKYYFNTDNINDDYKIVVSFGQTIKDESGTSITYTGSYCITEENRYLSQSKSMK